KRATPRGSGAPSPAPAGGPSATGTALEAPPVEPARLLAAAMAHDARNPLNAMMLQLELLRAQVRSAAPPGSEAFLGGLARLEREVERTSTVLQAYLDLLGEPAEPSPLELHALLAPLLEQAAARARARDVALRLV